MLFPEALWLHRQDAIAGALSDAVDERVAIELKLFTRVAMAGIADPILVTVHSFTPIFHGNVRDVEIGILHDSDSRLADALLSTSSANTPRTVRRNEPYGPTDGVTHTLKEHALPSGHLNVMLEVRNDLIATEVAQASMAKMISKWLECALATTVAKRC